MFVPDAPSTDQLASLAAQVRREQFPFQAHPGSADLALHPSVVLAVADQLTDALNQFCAHSQPTADTARLHEATVWAWQSMVDGLQSSVAAYLAMDEQIGPLAGQVHQIMDELLGQPW